MKQAQRKKKRISLLYILGGGILNEDFIVRHTKMAVMVVMLIVIFIGNRYSCTLKIKQIDTLQKELAEKKMEALSISIELTKYSRRSQIDARLRQQGIYLGGAQTPPYILHK
ncbi:MAG: hypothetical protein LBH04_04270 [Tannerellaceae bacterium]|jgi:hypothetical protein|nr:hypothetical protein [Tannerellaceae bacterium]